MTTVDLASYKNIYIKTAKEYIDNMSSCFAKLTQNAQDLETVNSLDISSHSLKSQSQVMGFTNMANLCATIEKISKAILEGGYEINVNFIAVLKESVEALSSCLSGIEKENREIDLGPVIKKLGDPSLRQV